MDPRETVGRRRTRLIWLKAGTSGGFFSTGLMNLQILKGGEFLD
jgi:hypothetical protein